MSIVKAETPEHYKELQHWLRDYLKRYPAGATLQKRELLHIVKKQFPWATQMMLNVVMDTFSTWDLARIYTTTPDGRRVPRIGWRAAWYHDSDVESPMLRVIRGITDTAGDTVLLSTIRDALAEEGLSVSVRTIDDYMTCNDWQKKHVWVPGKRAYRAAYTREETE